MKVCPKCGFVDVSHWRQNRWRTHVEFESMSYFKEEHPKMAKQLLGGHEVVTDKYYAYRFQENGWIVEKIWIELYKTGGTKAFHIPSEHFDHKQDPYLKTLADFGGEVKG